MKVWTTKFASLTAVVAVIACLGASCPPNGNENGNNNNNNNGNNNNNNNSNDNVVQLFVVNNTLGVSSFVNPAVIDNDDEAFTSLDAGANTNIFQPRDLVVTESDVLLVARQNGGITAHDHALTVSGASLADRTVDGNMTLADNPIALAYDPVEDTLYVGEASAADGILVYENCSDSTFDLNIAPSRKFNPANRAPTTMTNMSIDAMWFDDGSLYVAESTGANESTILVWDNARTAENQDDPDRTITSNAWDIIEALHLDTDHNLYVCDGSANVYIAADVSGVDGAVTLKGTLTVDVANASIEGIAIDSTGRGYLADIGNGEIQQYVELFERSGMEQPNKTLTKAPSCRDLWLVERAP